MIRPVSIAAAIAGLALCSGGSVALAETPPAWRVMVDVQIVTVSPADGLKLIPRLREPATFDEAFKDLQDMIERDTAELVGWPMLVGVGEDPVQSESVREVRFPTEFQPLDMPSVFSGFEEFEKLTDVPPRPIWGAASPTAFETSGVGVILTAKQASSEDGKIVRLSLEAQWHRLAGYQISHQAKTPSGIDGLIGSPEFLSDKTALRVAMHNGQRMLLGTFVEAKPAPRVCLFLLKASAVQIGEPSAFP